MRLRARVTLIALALRVCLQHWVANAALFLSVDFYWRAICTALTFHVNLQSRSATAALPHRMHLLLRITCATLATQANVRFWGMDTALDLCVAPPPRAMGICAARLALTSKHE